MLQQFVRTICYGSLTKWLKGTRKSTTFAVPTVCREFRVVISQIVTVTMTCIVGLFSNSKHTIQCPNIPSALRPFLTTNYIFTMLLYTIIILECFGKVERKLRKTRKNQSFLMILFTF